MQRHNATMLRVARLHVRDHQAAEEVVQETWLAVVKGLERFEARSTLKTWLFRILTNRAKTRGEREARSVPFSAVAAADASGDDHAVDVDRFQGPSDPFPGGWAQPPARWETLPDERLLSQETLRLVTDAVELLPPAQRAVIQLRDSTAGTPTRSASCSGSPTATSASCCTAPARRSGPNSSATLVTR